MPNNKKEGLHIEYFPNGNKIVEERYSNDKKNGLRIKYWRNGNRFSEGEYLDDKKIGYWTYWHMNGNKKCECEYLKTDNDKEKLGNCINWDENGKLEIFNNFMMRLREKFITFSSEEKAQYI